MGVLQTIQYNLLQLIYPNLCAGCNQALLANEEIICMHCSKNLPFTQPYVANNEIEKIFYGRVPIEKAISLLYFQKHSITQELLFKFKYKNRTDIGEILGKYMANQLQKNNFVHANSILIPVPLAPQKESVRGYNQSLILCNAISKKLQIPVCNNIIQRSKNTTTQTHKNRLERLQNVQDAFVIKELNLLNNKHVVLIDDVLTTGATLESCALQLLQNKTCTLSVATVAVASF